jgi:5-methylcytosine-specific restriction protein A
MTELDLAIKFLNNEIFLPANKSGALEEKSMNKVRYIQGWINSFDKVGDILLYLDRFQDNANTNKTSNALHNVGLKSFEDILEVFYKKFDHLRPDFTTINDFVEGFEYSAHKILTLAQSYDTRSGGILPIGSVQKTGSVVIKATLKGIAKETYVENQAITNSMPLH